MKGGAFLPLEPPDCQSPAPPFSGLTSGIIVPVNKTSSLGLIFVIHRNGENPNSCLMKLL